MVRSAAEATRLKPWPQARCSPAPFETRLAALLRMRADIHRAVFSIHRHRGEVHEPAFRLHEVLDLRAHGARANIVRDPQERRLLDRALVQGGERLVARGRLESDADIRGELVVFGIVDEAP